MKKGIKANLYLPKECLNIILNRQDEIKEILECLKKEDNYWSKQEHNYAFPDYYSLNREDLHLLLDYITNLQQENERLKENNDNMQEEMTRTWEENERLKKNKLTPDELANLLNQELIKQRDDYKSRCEKAIEYINDILYPIGSCVNGSDLPYESIESLLNILQNGSEDK